MRRSSGTFDKAGPEAGIQRLRDTSPRLRPRPRSGQVGGFGSADQGRSALPVDGFEYSTQAFCVCAPIPIGARRDRSRACGKQTRPRFGVMGVAGSATRVRGRRLHVKVASDPRITGARGNIGVKIKQLGA